MDIIRNIAKKLESKNRDVLSRAVAQVKHSFTEPAPEERKAMFCDPGSNRACVTVCGADGNCGRGCAEVREALIEELVRAGANVPVGNVKVGCGGTCDKGPIVGFPQKKIFYFGVKASDAARIVEETIMRGKLIFPLLSLDANRSYRSDIVYDKKTKLLAGIDEKVCMVDVAKYFLDFEDNLSCGKCVPCRIGMKRAHECVTRITAGEGTDEDLEQLLTLCKVMHETPNCDFASFSIRPLESALERFEDEFRAHIHDKMCSAGACKELVAHQRKLAVRARLSQKSK